MLTVSFCVLSRKKLATTILVFNTNNVVLHWVILAGTGQVTVNGKQFLLTENQSTFIPIGADHGCHKP
jgi:mannose-6-phosphate isomerase-like protein (cupin superfamily)